MTDKQDVAKDIQTVMLFSGVKAKMATRTMCSRVAGGGLLVEVYSPTRILITKNKVTQQFNSEYSARQFVIGEFV